jgi:hypothetical protein
MVQGSPAAVRASRRPWQCPCDAGFAGTQSARAKGSWRLSLIFQGTVWEARQCVAEPGSLKAAPERAMCQTVRVKLKSQWRPQEVRDVRDVEYVSKKAAGSGQSLARREVTWTARREATGLGCQTLLWMGTRSHRN